jgi:hypothetical protein
MAINMRRDNITKHSRLGLFGASLYLVLGLFVYWAVWGHLVRTWMVLVLLGVAFLGAFMKVTGIVAAWVISLGCLLWAWYSWLRWGVNPIHLGQQAILLNFVLSSLVLPNLPVTPNVSTRSRAVSGQEPPYTKDQLPIAAFREVQTNLFQQHWLSDADAEKARWGIESWFLFALQACARARGLTVADEVRPPLLVTLLVGRFFPGLKMGRSEDGKWEGLLLDDDGVTFPSGSLKAIDVTIGHPAKGSGGFWLVLTWAGEVHETNGSRNETIEFPVGVTEEMIALLKSACKALADFLGAELNVSEFSDC